MSPGTGIDHARSSTSRCDARGVTSNRAVSESSRPRGSGRLRQPPRRPSRSHATSARPWAPSNETSSASARPTNWRLSLAIQSAITISPDRTSCSAFRKTPTGRTSAKSSKPTARVNTSTTARCASSQAAPRPWTSRCGGSMSQTDGNVPWCPATSGHTHPAASSLPHSATSRGFNSAAPATS